LSARTFSRTITFLAPSFPLNRNSEKYLERSDAVGEIFFNGFSDAPRINAEWY
jgi:hypothetical protein